MYVSVEFPKYFGIDFVLKVCIILCSCTNAHILYLPFLGEASHDSKLQKQCLSTRYVLLLLIQLMQGAMMYYVIFVLAEAQEVITMDSSIFFTAEPNIPFFFIRHASDLLSVGQLFKGVWNYLPTICTHTYVHICHVNVYMSHMY